MANQSIIVAATNNPGKLKEFVLLLPNFKVISQDSLGITPDEELGETFFENSLQKARVANAASGMASLGDDSGLIVPALNNLPGLRSARYAHESATDEENRQHLKKELEKLMNLDCLVLNALRHKEHYSHINLNQALKIIEILKPKTTYLTHISYDMGFHVETEKLLPENVYLAYDGLQIEVD